MPAFILAERLEKTTDNFVFNVDRIVHVRYLEAAGNNGEDEVWISLSDGTQLNFKGFWATAIITKLAAYIV